MKKALRAAEAKLLEIPGSRPLDETLYLDTPMSCGGLP